MPEEKEAQAKPEGKQASQENFDDLFAKGWAATVDAPEAPAAAPTPPKVGVAVDDCPDCPPVGSESKDRKPIRVLKHQGKEIPVYSQKQLDDLAQQGFDYTKKRQADAEEKRRFESDFETKNRQLMDQAQRLDAMLKAAETKLSPAPAPGAKAEPAPPAAADDESTILKKYGIDPDYATDYEKKVAFKLHESDKKLEKVEQVAQIMLINEVFRRVTDAIGEARKEYPIEDVQDDKGESVTQKQVLDIFRTKVSATENKHRPIQELARETIKDIHELQQRGTAPTGSLDDMPLEEVMKKYPKLYAKISGGNGGNDGLPPSMDRGARAPERTPSRPTSSDGKHRFKSIEEALEAGFKDPETIKAFTGG